MTQTTNEVPWLRARKGTTPAHGGCILQVIDWIDRCEWTDQPPCVHPVLARLAIRANDQADDEQRQELLRLAPRLMGTASDDRVLSVRLAVFCARQVLPIFEERFPDDGRPRGALDAAEAWCDLPSAAAAAHAAAAAAAAFAAAAAHAADAAHAAAHAAHAAFAAAADAADAAHAVYAVYAAHAVYAVYAAHAAAYAAFAAAGPTSHDLLLSVLDEYDRLTGRKNHELIDWSPVCAVMQR